MKLTVYRTDGDPTSPRCFERIADGTPDQVVTQLLAHLDTRQLHNLQAVELPRVRMTAASDSTRAPPIVVPVPADESVYDHDDDRR